VLWFALVQDYIPGFSLQELLEQQQVFDEEKIRKIAKEILEILIYLHELNPPVLHRDLKPDLINWLEIMTESSVERRFSSAKTALEALISANFVDTSRSKESPTQQSLKIKPEKSSIKLEQDPQRLNITIPAGGLARFNEIFNAGCRGLIFYFLLFSFSLLISIFIPYIVIFLILFISVYTISFMRN
jgi:tRNA threonylcarbamoyladenosine modification (KEOPS) complex  Pcc1 subunit